MKIKKNGQLEYKIFKEKDLRRLADYFVVVKEELKDDNTEIRLEVEFEDGSSITGFDSSILDESETKIVKKIHFILINIIIKKEMTIYMTTMGAEYGVGSKNRNWVDAKFAQLQEIFNTTPNQNYWLSNFKWQSLINNLIGLTFGFSFYFFILKKLIDEETLGNDIAVFFIIMFSAFIGQIFAHFLLNQLLYKLYPTIEFDTTSDHLNKNKKKKAAIWSIFILVILPLILSFFSSLAF